MFENFDIRQILLMVVPVLLALTVHEYAHGLAAYRLGDPTAKNEGRLTLNPLAHLDPLGTVMLFFSGLFGWAKPVPFNPRYFQNPVRDTTLVALAGPASNFLAAALIALVKELVELLIDGQLFDIRAAGLTRDVVSIIYISIYINISIGIFNLLPLPPLDGFKVLSYFLPPDWVALAYQYSAAFFVLFLILVVTGVLRAIMEPMILVLFQILAG